MKLFYTLILLLAFTLPSKAQQYNSIVNEGAEWNNYYRYFDPQGGDSGPKIRHHFIKGDTLIDSVSYKKLWQYSFDSTSTYDYYKLYLSGLLREAERKVFFRSCKKCRIGINDSIDYIIYDFDLSVGDTFHLPGFLPFATDATVNIVTTDTISVVNGDTLKTLGIRSFNSSNGSNIDEYYLIDSIGCTDGLLNHNFVGGGWEYTKLMCMSNGNFNLDSSTIRNLPRRDDSYWISWLDCYHLDPAGISKKVAESSISWYAEGGQLIVSGLETDQLVLMHSMDGRLIKSQHVQSDKIVMAPNEAHGIYMVSVLGAKQVYSFLVSTH